MLAIAAPSFDGLSETFIAAHVRLLSPGNIALICNDDRGTAAFKCPVLSPIEQAHNAKTKTHQAVGRIRRRLQRYTGFRLRRGDRNRVRRFFRAHQVSVVLAEYGHVGVQLAAICKSIGIPLYVHFHGFDANILPNDPRIRRQYKFLFRTVAGVIVASKFLRGRLIELGCPGSLIHECPLGVEIRDTTGMSVRGRIVTVSRLVKQKGVIHTVKSVHRLIKGGHDVSLVVIGEGPELGALERYIGENNLLKSVHLAGGQAHEFVLHEMERAQIYAQHCISVENGGVESFGLSIVEAMAAGLPVVATRHGAIPETVVHGQTGFLVDEYDTRGMASAIAHLIENPQALANFSKAGRQRAIENYTLEKSIGRLRQILQLG